MNRDDYILLVLAAVLVGAVVYAFISTDGFLVEGNIMDEVAEMKEEMGMATALPNLGAAPDPVGIVDWINTEPLSGEDLRGKVVLVDFWTYSCINCIRTFPFIRDWYETYKNKGFVLLGVHTPEFDFERKRENVVQAARENDLTYPIALDNDYVTWRAFNNRYWPAHYLLDVEGNLRYFHFGEGKYGETEAAIQQLLVEGGLAQASGFSAASEDETARDLQDVGSPAGRASPGGAGTPEIYLGYRRISNFGSAADDVRGDEPYTFAAPTSVTDNTFYLSGTWTIGPEAAELNSESGSIIIRFRAREANIVLEREGGETAAEVLLDGAPLTAEAAGDDVIVQNGRAQVRIGASRLYNLVSLEESGWHTLELRMSESGVRGFAFTFG